MLLDPTLIDGRYRLGAQLGAGAFGSVHKATQVVFERNLRDVALKLFHSDFIHPGNVAEQMNDALTIIDLLSQSTDWEIRQHFVTIYDLGVTREAEPRAFIAMELVRDGSLSRRLRDFGKFTLAGAYRYLRQLARALAFMHAQGFVHSDLKPDNVLIFRRQERDLVKIGDFGLAGRYQGLFGESPRGGTMAYLCPEALQGVNTTPSGDVFSLGVMAYELLTGANPYAALGSTLTPAERQDSRKINALQLAARARPLRLNRADFPEAASAEFRHLAPVLDIINRMLATSPAERYPSAQEVYSDLERVSGREVAAPVATARAPVSAPPADRFASDWDFAVRQQNWPAATQAANDCIQHDPAAAQGYVLKSRVSQRQAEALAASGGASQVVQSLRRQAAAPLQAGLRACSDPAAQQQLRQELAALFRTLGDLETARQYAQPPASSGGAR